MVETSTRPMSLIWNAVQMQFIPNHAQLVNTTLKSENNPDEVGELEKCWSFVKNVNPLFLTFSFWNVHKLVLFENIFRL